MDLLDPLHAVCSTDRNPSVINDNFQITPELLIDPRGGFPVAIKVPCFINLLISQNLVVLYFYLPL